MTHRISRLSRLRRRALIVLQDPEHPGDSALDSSIALTGCMAIPLGLNSGQSKNPAEFTSPPSRQGSPVYCSRGATARCLG